MSLSMPSHQVQELIAGYVLGDLSPDEAVTLEQLLAEHPELIQEIALVQQALDMTYAPSEVAPPALLRDRVLTQAQSTVRTTAEQPLTTLPFAQRRLPWGRVAGTAAAVTIVALSIANYQLWQTLQSLRAPGGSASFTYALEGTEAAQRATAKIVVNPETLDATLTVENLPPLPPGKVYVLWTVVGKNAPFTTDEKGAILTQVFQVSEAGDFSGTIAVPAAYQMANLVTRLAVTIEDENAPQAHQGVMTLSTPLQQS